MIAARLHDIGCFMVHFAVWRSPSAQLGRRLGPLGRLGAAALLAALLGACQSPAERASDGSLGGLPAAPAAAAPASSQPAAAPGAVSAAVAPIARASDGARPRLVVVLIIDGLPQRQLLAYRDQLAPDGLMRFLARGAWFGDAHHGHAHTVTAAGHAAILTGAYPQRSGIIANEWRDARTGEPVYCTSDVTAQYIGHKTQPLDGTSPRNLKVETLGDVLRRADPRAKVIAVSGKDRGAILPAGQLGTAYMYMAQTGLFASSTYYMQRHPDWVEAFNARRPADRWFKQWWKPLLPDAAYARSLPDRQSWYGQKAAALPMMMGAPADEAPGPAYYSQLLRSPFADQLTLDFARAAIAGEALGQDEVPDILSISLSAHDYINHRYSAESRFSHDHLLQLDRMLQDFFRDLDAAVGPDRYLAVLTSDHGFMPAPEYTAQQGLRSGRINGAQLLARLNLGLQERFGAGRWVSYSGSSLLIDAQTLALHRADADEVAEEARSLLLEEPGIAAAYTRRELSGERPVDGPFFTAMQRSWHPEVSGDVQYALKPYWMFGSSASIATHGSPYPYDTHVPLLLWGPRWVRPAQIDERVEVVDLAPTLARWLGLPPPAAAQGRVLPLSR